MSDKANSPKTETGNLHAATDDDLRASPGDADFEVPFKQLRQPAAINLFKFIVLGTSHVPGEHQVKLVMEVLSAAGLGESLDARTWKGWFGERPRRARRDGLASLDRLLDVLKDPRRAEFPDADPTHTFFRSLVEDGLASRLLAPTRAKSPASALLQRAHKYRPLSAIHLHFDAIEVAGMSEGNEEVAWEETKGLAARRLMDLLHERWSPRTGTIYAEFANHLKSTWDRAEAAGLDELQSIFGLRESGSIEREVRFPTKPNWQLASVSSDIPAAYIHRLLLGISADSRFLAGFRLQGWALDLASAALTMHALAWTQRYLTTEVRPISPELIFWRGLELLFYSDEPEDVIKDGLSSALAWIGIHSHEECIKNLLAARSDYRQCLQCLAIDVALVSRTVSRCWRELPLVYGGG